MTIEALWLLGRLCIGALFVAGALHHCVAFAQVAQQVAARGVPMPRLVLAIGSLWQATAGVLLVLNIQVVYAALALVAFTLVASLMLLDFWNMQGAERTGMLTSWRLNIAVIGGLLITTAYGLARGA